MCNEMRTKILEAAKEMFLKSGYRETKITDIAKAANISPSTIYLYFKGKKELFKALQIPEAEDFHPQYDTKRTAIIEAALLLFGEKGFDGTSMNMIAQKSNYSKATLYQYFENKEDLFSAVMKETPFYYNFLSIQPKADELNLDTVIKEIGYAYMSMFDSPERTAFTRSIIRDSNKHPEISNIYHEYGIGYVSNCVAGYLIKHKQLLRSGLNPYLVAKTYIGSLFSFAIEFKIIYGIERQYTDKEFVDMSAEIFLNGILK